MSSINTPWFSHHWLSFGLAGITNCVGPILPSAIIFTVDNAPESTKFEDAAEEEVAHNNFPDETASCIRAPDEVLLR